MTTKDEAREECKRRVEERFRAKFGVAVGNISVKEWNQKVAAESAAFDAYAQAAVDAKDARIAQLKALLKPFAEYEFPEGEILRTSDRFHPMTYGTGELTVGDFRRAAAALKGDADDEIRRRASPDDKHPEDRIVR